MMKYKYKCSDEDVTIWSPGFGKKLEIQMQRNYIRFSNTNTEKLYKICMTEMCDASVTRLWHKN